MLLVYDDDNVLHITNEKGLRWNYSKTQKPQFSFDYDSLFYCPFQDETDYNLNDEKLPLSDEHISEIEEYINKSEDFNQATGVAVRIEKFSDSSIDLLVRCFTNSNSWSNSLEVKERLAIEIKKIVEKNGASFAFPSQSIYVEKK